MWMDIFRSVPEIENSMYKGPEEEVCLPYSRNSKETSVSSLKLQGRAARDQTTKGFIGCWGDLSFCFVRQDTIGGFSAGEFHDLSLEEDHSGYHIENRYIPTYWECPFEQNRCVLKFFLFQMLIQKSPLPLPFPKPYHIELIILFL